MDIDNTPPPHQGGQQVLKPVACQFYNYIAHRTATRAGKHDTQQGTITAAIAGGFAETQQDRKKATIFINHCDTALPSHRFQKHIDVDDCPSSCRAELVYSVDIRALRHPTGRFVYPYSFLLPPSSLFSVRSIFNDIISPLANAWKHEDIIEVVQNYLLILTPDVRSPFLPPSISLSQTTSFHP
jgi:hypothetical protein